MEMPDKPQELSAYLDRHFTCSCGREHHASLKRVSIRKGALEDLPKFAKELSFHHPYLVSDSITYEIAGKSCMDLLNSAGIQAKIQVLQHIGFEEATIGELLFNMPLDCDLVVAVGTGAINDMTRFFSYRTGRPFFTVATAAPMDGFASSIGVLNINHLKTTVDAQTPTVIIGDTDILKNAPYCMIAAGLGDLLGKFTCLCDWKIAKIITGEHYCGHIVELVESCVRNVLRDADKAADRDPQVLGDIMSGLVLTGVAMSLYGNSRPASGCEHHMSHYWEMMFEQKGERPVPHGTQVSVGTVLVLKLIEALRRRKIDFDAARVFARSYDEEDWENAIHRAYGPAADGVIEMEKTVQKNAVGDHLKRIDQMEQHWDEITALLEALPSSKEIITLLRSLQSPCFPQEIGVKGELLKNTFLYSKEVRARYTLLQMVWDLGLLDSLSDEVIAECTID